MKTESYTLRTGETITIPVPTSYADCVELIRSDFFRYFGYVSSFGKMFLKSLSTPPFALTFWLRLAQIKGFWYWPAKIMHRHYSVKY